MKVILLRDVAKIGHRFDVVTVPDGYAQNKLIPQGAAMPATGENMKRVRAQADVKAHGAAKEQQHFSAVVNALSDTRATLAMKANADGGLFEAVKVDALAKALTAVAGIPVLASYLEIVSPIKHTGEHEVALVHDGKRHTVTVIVTNAT